MPSSDFKYFLHATAYANPLTHLVDKKLKIVYDVVKNYSTNRWGTQHVFGCKIPLVLICKGEDYLVMLVVYVQERKIRYFDSLKCPNQVFCDLMDIYLEEEWKALGSRKPIDDHKDGPWTLVKKSPQEPLGKKIVGTVEF